MKCLLCSQTLKRITGKYVACDGGGHIFFEETHPNPNSNEEYCKLTQFDANSWPPSKIGEGHIVPCSELPR